MSKRIIIVGAGISGSLLALELLEQNCQVTLYDNPSAPGSSHIAAGMINPITGRKFVKSWHIDELLKQVKQTYAKLEQKYNFKALYPIKVLRAIKSTSMLNDWSARLNDPEYQQFIRTDIDSRRPKGIKKEYLDFTLIKDAFRVDFTSVIDAAKNNADIKFYSESFNYDSLSFETDGTVGYSGESYDMIVFCEGNGVRHNPFWNWLQFVPARGERLIIHAPDLKLDHVFNDGKIIIPLDDDLYWVGSNYDWDLLEPQTTEEGRKELTDYLDSTISVDYEIVNHAAHVRPATYNRRPFVGAHPDHKHCYILNGMGAKGASLSPFCVKQLIDHIFEQTPIHPEIAVSRSFEHRPA